MNPIIHSISFGWNPVPECERIVIGDAPHFMDGLKIVFAADAHIYDRTPDEYVESLTHTLGAQGGDMLLLGGDYGESRRAAGRLFSALGRQRFPLGIFGVIGNNDAEVFEDDMDGLRQMFPGTLLINEMRSLPYRSGTICIGGLDELGYGIHPARSFFPRNKRSYSILLSHYPKLPFAASEVRPRLMLSGHTHGGQFRLMSLTPYTIGFEHGKADLVFGEKTFGNTRLFVSNGVGVSRLPLRINCPSRVHVFEFRN